jgi:hypothetical protein
MTKLKLRMLEALPLLIALALFGVSMRTLDKAEAKRRAADEASAKRVCELEKDYIKVQCKQLMDACNK